MVRFFSDTLDKERSGASSKVWSQRIGVALAVMLAWYGFAQAAPAPGNSAPASHDHALSGDEKAAIEDVIRDVLRRHPEIVGEAMQAVMTRQAQAEETRTRQNNRLQAAALLKQKTGLTRGNPAGDVVVVKFSDYGCGWCRRAHNGVLEEIAEDGGVHFLYREFPVLGPASVFASQAALASARQDRYADFNNQLMTRPGRVSEMSVLSLAEEMGLDVERLQADMQSAAIADTLEANRRIAEALGVRGTPAFLVGDRLYRGYLSKEELKEAIAHARSEAAG